MPDSVKFRPDWPEYFMAVAKVISTRSACSSRPVGCVITRENRILVTGYNGPPSGAPHCREKGQHFCQRRADGVSEKDKQAHCPSVHAEENAVTLAERLGVSLAGATAYVTLSPCGRCIDRLARAGVQEVYYEMAYQSADTARDAAWELQAKASFRVYKAVSIGRDALAWILAAIWGQTSERRLDG